MSWIFKDMFDSKDVWDIFEISCVGRTRGDKYCNSKPKVNIIWWQRSRQWLHAKISFPRFRELKKDSTMLNRRELAIFVALYLYMVNMSTANDMRRVIILASLIQIHALRAQLLILNQRRIQRRRRAGRLRRRFWVLPRPVQSWFDIHFVDIAIPDDYFRRQLRLNRTTFTMLLNTLRPRSGQSA